MQKIRRYLEVLLVAATIAMLSITPARAWDGVVAGKVSQLDVTHGESLGLRVLLEGVNTEFCTGGPAWGYINRSWDNYDAAAALLTSAWLSGKTVTLYMNKVGSYCEISYLQFR